MHNRLFAPKLKDRANNLAYVEQLEQDVDVLTDELVTRQDELVTLYRLTQSMRHCLSIDELVSAMMNELMSLVPAETIFFATSMLTDTFEVQFFNGNISEELIKKWFKTTQTGETLLRSNGLPTEIWNLLMTPVNINDGWLGAIGIVNKEGEFTSSDRKLLRVIGEQVGAQIENVLLHEARLKQVQLQSEMALAHAVQLRLLPRYMPKVAGLDIAGRSIPAREVGGDFYDAVELRNGLGVAVGDVSGKGMSAAMLMGMTRTTLRNAIQFDPDISSPAEHLKKAGLALYDDFTEVGMFATMFSGFFDTQTQQFHFANAGHSPVIYCPANGQAILLEADGVPLGVLEDCLVTNRTVSLGADDMLLIGTDGLSEACNNDGDMFGYEPLLRLAESLRNKSADIVLQKMLATIDKFSAGHEQDDDQTLVVLKGLPS